MASITVRKGLLTQVASLDPESKKFIAWVMGELESDEVYFSLVLECLEAVQYFLQQPKRLILPDLKKKLIKGGLEHGAPKYSVRRIRQELKAEHLDLIGWRLIGKYNALGKKGKNIVRTKKASDKNF